MALPERCLIKRGTPSVEASFNQSITRASNSAVNPEPGSAHGTDTVTTPCSSHFTRGTSATRIVLYWHVSRCRYRRGRESYPGDSFPQVGQHDLTPSSCSTCTVTSPSGTLRLTPDTCQGLLIPRIWAYKSFSLIPHTVIYPLDLGKSQCLKSQSI